MPRRLRLEWISPPTRIGRRTLVAVLVSVGFAGLAGALWLVKSNHLAELQAQPGHSEKSSVSRLISEDERIALREEITAVNRPIRQLNQQWDTLLAELQPTSAAVRLLEIDVDGITNRVRIVGRSPSIGNAVDFAAQLATRRELGEVVLARHEIEEGTQPAYRFIVEARWLSGR